MKLKNKIKKDFVFFIIITTFLVANFIPAFTIPLYQPLIVRFGDSNEVTQSVHTLVQNYPEAKVLDFKEIHSLIDVLTIMRSYSAIILVGHGSNNGILGPNGVILSWKEIGAWINSLPNSYVIILSCNSNIAKTFINKPFIGFSEDIDAISGGLIVAGLLKKLINHEGLTTSFLKTANSFLDRNNALALNKAKPLFLSTESGYTLAFKYQYYYQQACFIVCVKYVEENILWINTEGWIATAIATGTSAILNHYSTLIGGVLASYTVGQDILGVALTASFWADVIFWVLLIIWVNIIVNVGTRPLHDAKFGIGAQYVPVWMQYAKFDDNGFWVSYPEGTVSAPVLAAAFALFIPSHWVKVL